MSELKPCPFCGEGAETSLRHKSAAGELWTIVHSGNWNCPVRWDKGFYTEAEAIAAWNTRTPAASVEAGEVWKAAYEAGLAAVTLPKWDEALNRGDLDKAVADSNAAATAIIDQALKAAEARGAENERAKAKVWEEVASQSAGHLDCIMLYATSYPTDSHVTNANAFLIKLRAILGIRGAHRTQTQIRLENHLPIPPFPATAIETGAHDG